LIPNVLSILFTVVGAVQMWFWAVFFEPPMHPCFAP